jgi:glucose-1-phosphate cytidylyltransferase
MVLQPEIFDYLEGDSTVFEKEPMERLVEEHQLMSFVHEGFWQCMDNVREKQMLEKLLATGCAPWKRWDRDVPRKL